MEKIILDGCPTVINHHLSGVSVQSEQLEVLRSKNRQGSSIRLPTLASVAHLVKML
ncbi:hypothetical protein M595_2158 [Lyngbya aestuarii BL J]|uniref:Uncharacterized protein n=1 Tax=Lyngbya aestuarii BL J TaxID=1348334 RepID=U7QIM4_9CYAN|nr:hypothetical protein M595_2158 [Lyngbya aestuarii BL J]